jgi:long-chain acyl-CoA synthetase
MNTAPWLAHYRPGVRWDADLRSFALHEELFATAERFPHRPAIEFLGHTIDYAEYAALVRRLARGLQLQGVGPGVQVGLYLPNTPHYLISFFAVLAAGGVVVNLSPLDVEDVLAKKLQDSDASVLITLRSSSLYPQARSLLERLPLRSLVVGELTDFAADHAAVDEGLRRSEASCELRPHPAQCRFLDLLDNGADFESVSGDAIDRLAVLQYTGGTTGLPKGAMLLHRNLSVASSQLIEMLGGSRPVLMPGEERILVVLPLFHIFAMLGGMLLGLRLAAELVLHQRFDAGEVARTIASRRITMFCGVPTMFTALVTHPETSGRDLRSLKFCNTGGAPIADEVARQFEALTGVRLTEGWGMTESSALGTMSPFKGMTKTGSCGVPLPGIELRFVSLENKAREVRHGERGEICIKGPNVMPGYWKRPDATREAFTADGYLYTGDVGVMDEDGYLRIVDRTKDMLLCSGYNVYPRVIEEAIYQHPAVEEVCVIGVPDAYRGESPKAFIKLRAGAAELTLDELKQFLKSRLGKHEMVQALELRNNLPKTAIGKLFKRGLVEEEAAKRVRASNEFQTGVEEE